jgi:hypothetical protein
MALAGLFFDRGRMSGRHLIPPATTETRLETQYSGSWVLPASSEIGATGVFSSLGYGYLKPFSLKLP